MAESVIKREYGVRAIKIVSGTTGALNTEISIPFPSDFTANDTVVIGFLVKNVNGTWYSNVTNDAMTVGSTSSVGIRITAKSSGYVNQPIKVICALI